MQYLLTKEEMDALSGKAELEKVLTEFRRKVGELVRRNTQGLTGGGGFALYMSSDAQIIVSAIEQALKECKFPEVERRPIYDEDHPAPG